jgi:hypothetical protein
MSKPTPTPWHVSEFDWNGTLHQYVAVLRGGLKPSESKFSRFATIGYLHFKDLDDRPFDGIREEMDMEANAAHIVKCVNMHDDFVREIQTYLDHFDPKECNCDGEYVDGRLVGHACYFHRFEESFKQLLSKAEEE